MTSNRAVKHAARALADATNAPYTQALRAVTRVDAAHQPAILTIGTGQGGEDVTIDLATAGHLLIAGPAGTGKTRLVEALVAQARDNGWPVVTVPTTHPDQAMRALAEGVGWVAYKQRSDVEPMRTPVLVVVDQAGLLDSYYGDDMHSTRAGAADLLFRLVRGGAGVGVYVIVTRQRPNAKDASSNGAHVWCGPPRVLGVSVMFPGVDVPDPGDAGVLVQACPGGPVVVARP